MEYATKIVLHCPNGLHEGLEPLVQAFMRSGVTFVAVAGKDVSLIEDIIDETCAGDGSRSYSMAEPWFTLWSALAPQGDV